MRKYCVFLSLVVLLALVIAILGIVEQPVAQKAAAWMGRFFVGMLPVLGVAALLKYIACCGNQCKCCANNSCCKGGESPEKKVSCH